MIHYSKAGYEERTNLPILTASDFYNDMGKFRAIVIQRTGLCASPLTEDDGFYIYPKEDENERICYICPNKDRMSLNDHNRYVFSITHYYGKRGAENFDHIECDAVQVRKRYDHPSLQIDCINIPEKDWISLIGQIVHSNLQ